MNREIFTGIKQNRVFRVEDECKMDGKKKKIKMKNDLMSSRAIAAAVGRLFFCYFFLCYGKRISVWVFYVLLLYNKLFLLGWVWVIKMRELRKVKTKIFWEFTTQWNSNRWVSSMKSKIIIKFVYFFSLHLINNIINITIIVRWRFYFRDNQVFLCFGNNQHSGKISSIFIFIVNVWWSRK